ncbi:transporter [Vallitalea longa]|uniref:Transporter n=1 Tax=Vallitalea longa TaxID=2936439 RepID=A0A9W6DFW1_9FIRM|nr:AzlD domain-containing protein [Vallitalea longa]GKX29838.1 transporter [Vallitalea longa]
MTITNQFIAVLIMAVVTYIPRVAPLVIFKRKIKSKFLCSFLSYVPYAVLGAMTFPSILYSTKHIYSAVAGLLTALVVAYFDKSLIKVAVSAILTVYIFELLI